GEGSGGASSTRVPRRPLPDAFRRPRSRAQHFCRAPALGDGHHIEYSNDGASLASLPGGPGSPGNGTGPRQRYGSPWRPPIIAPNQPALTSHTSHENTPQSG